MAWEESLKKLFAFQTEKELYANNGRHLTTVIDEFLMPGSAKSAKALSAQWEHSCNNITANILGIACADLIKGLKGDSERNDGSPSITHEYSQTYYLHALLQRGFNIERPDILACIIMLHDVGEEHGLKRQDIRGYLQNWVQEKGDIINPLTQKALFNDIEMIVDGYWDISRFIQGEKAKMDKVQYIKGTLYNPFTSIAKPLDRIHNIATPDKKHAGKKIDETGLLFMTPIYELDGLPGRHRYFEAATHLHPQNEELYSHLHSIIGTALNLRIAGRVNKAELDKHGRVVMDDVDAMIPEDLRETNLPRVLRPLRILTHRIREQASPR